MIQTSTETSSPGGLARIARTVGEWETRVSKTGCDVFSFEIHCCVSVNIMLLLSCAKQGFNARENFGRFLLRGGN